jgi:hypothetical protein
MTRDDIIRLAREAGFGELMDAWPLPLERFAALVAAAEREKSEILLEGLRQVMELPEDSRIHYKVAKKAVNKAAQVGAAK